MFEKLVQLADELSTVLDEVEREALHTMLQSNGVQRRQAVTVIERVRTARAVTSDQLSTLMREVRAVEVR